MATYNVDKMIKIIGTDYDRRRKLTSAQIEDIKTEYSRGLSICTSAKKYKVVPNTIHYHVDEEFKKFHNSRRKYSVPSKESSKTRASRIEYKKKLLSTLV